jgi:formamidopyrimidine-DNA glycosylase
MPELPEVETVVRALAHEISGLRIAKAVLRTDRLRTAVSKDIPRKLKGAVVSGVSRRAKYILIELDNNQTLLLHLGMSGTIRILPGKEKVSPFDRHDHLALYFESGRTLVFRDPRRFGVIALYPSEHVAQSKELAHLGIEPFSKRMTPEYLHGVFAGRAAAIKTALMDQKILVGVGNIYASEALFHARIDPRRAAGTLNLEEWKKLAVSLRKVLKAAITAGGSTLRNYRKADGEIGGFQERFAVYDRAGKACPGCACALRKTGGIQKIVQGGRSTFYCPVRQV